MFSLLAYPFPTITAKKGHAARTKLHTSLRKWYNAGHSNDPDVSVACQARINVLKKYGLSPDEIGEDNLGLLFVSTTNAMPTLFWFFIFVFNSPSLVSDLQQELQSVVSRDGNKMTINHTQFSEKCPLLCSAYQETMRLTNVQGGTRKVLVDTILSSAADTSGARKEYLLKAGAILQTPASITHTSPSIWGPTSPIFDPRRFMNLGDGDKAAEKLQKKAFIPFGGGKHYCPGRHFALAEILGFIAVMVLGFDIEGVKIVGSERAATNAVLKPDREGYELAVRIRRRPGLERVKWGFVEY
jgi:cytochrome P450